MGRVYIELHLKNVGGLWERHDPEYFGKLPEPVLFNELESPPKGRTERKRDRSESLSPGNTRTVPLLDDGSETGDDWDKEELILDNEKEEVIMVLDISGKEVSGNTT